ELSFEKVQDAHNCLFARLRSIDVIEFNSTPPAPCHGADGIPVGEPPTRTSESSSPAGSGDVSWPGVERGETPHQTRSRAGCGTLTKACPIIVIFTIRL